MSQSIWHIFPRQEINPWWKYPSTRNSKLHISERLFLCALSSWFRNKAFWKNEKRSVPFPYDYNSKSRSGPWRPRKWACVGILLLRSRFVKILHQRHFYFISWRTDVHRVQIRMCQVQPSCCTQNGFAYRLDVEGRNLIFYSNFLAVFIITHDGAFLKQSTVPLVVKPNSIKILLCPILINHHSIFTSFEANLLQPQ